MTVKTSAISIDKLELSARAYNCLQSAGLITIGHLVDATDRRLLSIQNFGRRSLLEVREVTRHMVSTEQDTRKMLQTTVTRVEILTASLKGERERHDSSKQGLLKAQKESRTARRELRDMREGRELAEKRLAKAIKQLNETTLPERTFACQITTLDNKPVGHGILTMKMDQGDGE